MGEARFSEVKAGYEDVIFKESKEDMMRNSENTKEDDVTNESEKSVQQEEITNSIQRRENSTPKYEEKNIVEPKSNESDSFQKEETKKKKKDNQGRKKTREFKPNELDALRDEFAKKQGVKEVKNISTSKAEFDKKQGENLTKDINTTSISEFDQKQAIEETTGTITMKQADTDNSQVENIPVNNEHKIPVTSKEQLCVHDISIKDNCGICEEAQSHTTLKDFSPIKEERKKKGRKSKEIKEINGS